MQPTLLLSARKTDNQVRADKQTAMRRGGIQVCNHKPAMYHTIYTCIVQLQNIYIKYIHAESL